MATEGKAKKNGEHGDGEWGGGEFGKNGRHRWADEPDGLGAAHRSLPVHHGLCLLEGRQAPRPGRVIRSGLPNFCAVALALSDLGYKAAGIRLDSGDLAYLSLECRKFFRLIEKEFGKEGFGRMPITASNDLNQETLDALKKQGHEIDAIGIGTYLVTCYAQAALGCVFKLVEIKNVPRIKLAEEVSKVSIPCKKGSYRMYSKGGYPLVDIMTGENEPPPRVGERILCRHPFNESKRAYVVPQKVEELVKCYWPGKPGKKREELPTLKDVRDRCIQQLGQMRPGHMRRLNPTPYKECKC